MQCSACVERLEEFHIGALPPDEQAILAEHLENCGSCARELDAILRAEQMLDSVPETIPAPPPAPLRHSLLRAAAILVIAGCLGATYLLAKPGKRPMQPAQQPVPTEREKISALVRALGADDFDTRERATRQLRARGSNIVPILREELGRSTDPEVTARLEEILEFLTRPRLELANRQAPSEYFLPRNSPWSPDGGRIVVVGGPERGTVMCVDAAGQKLQTWQSPSTPILGACFSPDGALLAIATTTRLTIVRSKTFETVFSTDVGGGVWYMGFCDDGRLLFAQENNWSLWEAKREGDAWSARMIREPPQGAHFVLSPGGKWICYWVGAREVHVRSTSTWDRVARIKVPDSVLGDSTRQLMAFSPDSRYFALEAWSGEILIFETSSWDKVKQWKPGGLEPQFAFSQDSRYLLIAGDLRIRAFEVGTWAEVAGAEIPRSLRRLLVSPAGNSFLLEFSEDDVWFTRALYRLERP